MSGHGKRETILMADATRWRNRVRADLASPAGCAAMSEHKLLSVRSVDDVADVTAAPATTLAATASAMPAASGA